MPLRTISGSAGVGAGGGGALTCVWAGAGMRSHFIEKTSFPSSVRPIGAHGSRRAAASRASLGVSLVWPQAGAARGAASKTKTAIRNFVMNSGVHGQAGGTSGRIEIGPVRQRTIFP